MSVVYVSARLITAPGEPGQILGVWEFENAAWEIALAMAYDWLKQNRKITCTYHVYC